MKLQIIIVIFTILASTVPTVGQTSQKNSAKNAQTIQTQTEKKPQPKLSPMVRETIREQPVIVQPSEKEIKELVEKNIESSQELRDRIQTEVQHNFLATTILLNTLLLVIILLIVSSTFAIWVLRKVIIHQLVNDINNQLKNATNQWQSDIQEILAGEVKQQVNFAKQIEELQSESIKKIETSVVREAKILLEEIKTQHNLLEETIIQFHQMTMNNISQISSGNLSNGQVLISEVLESKAHSGELIDNNIVAEYFKQGNILLEQGRYEEANNYYNEALKINKDLAEIRYQNARCYALRGSTNLAIGNLEWAIDINAKYKDKAENDPAFDSIRFNEHFKTVLNEVRN